jgi:prepilin-type N-terminal cleavage/methylation domain-containing protein
MKKTTSGFTIVELLVVIVVIAILAAVTIVAYNGIQSRARDTQRASDISSILKSLEAYKVINDVYPTATSTSGGGSYELSTETAGTFMEYLVPTYFSKTPVDPINDGTRFYRYYRYTPNTMATYGCSGRGGLMVLYAFGFENSANMPASDPTVTCGSQSWSGGSSYLFKARFENG